MTPDDIDRLRRNNLALLAAADKSLRWLIAERDCHYEGASTSDGFVPDLDDQQVLAAYDRDIDELQALIVSCRGDDSARIAAIATIDSLFPADSRHSSIAMIGRRLLNQARTDVAAWRDQESDAVLARYAQLCVLEEQHELQIAHRNSTNG